MSKALSTIADCINSDVDDNDGMPALRGALSHQKNFFERPNGWLEVDRDLLTEERRRR
jgi:hypothetical protein